MDPRDLLRLERTDSLSSLVSTRSDTSYNRNRNRGYNRGGNHRNRGDNHSNRGGNHRGGKLDSSRGGLLGNNGAGNHGNKVGNHGNRGGNYGNRGGNHGSNGGSNHGHNRGGNHVNRGNNHDNRGNNHGNRGNNHSNRGNNEKREENCTSRCNLNERIRGFSARGSGSSRGPAHNRGNRGSNFDNTQYNFNDIHILARGSEYGGSYVQEDETKSESGYTTGNGERASNNGRDKHPKQFPLGFQKLEEFSKMDSDELILIVSNEKSGWNNLLQTKLSEDKLVLIIRIVKKVCELAFPQMKSKILLQICATGFVEQLRGYLNNLLLHNERDKRNNKYFWNTCNQFFNELIIIFDNILQLVPKTAGEILPKLLGQTCITVSQIGNLHFGTVVEESVKQKLEELQLKLTLCKEKAERKKIKQEADDLALDSEDDIEEELEEPPDDFRLIAVRPTLQEIISEEPVFIRSNVVKGKYKSVNHYLDIHFRLLREDFVAPLRTAICEYRLQNEARRQHGTRAHIFNVRFYHNVLVLYSMLQQDKVAYVVQLTMKKEKLKLDNSRRLMFGSLLCFTSDNFKSITFATIANRDRNLLMQGQIGVQFLTQPIEFNKKYTMLECSVYFEPYYHVLRALQSITEDTFPLKQYIIDVQADVQPPAYYRHESRIHYSGANFFPFIPLTWPVANRLKMDESQFRAFQAAITREFCVIQGPPGTGKTYIGLKIAELLLENHETWNQKRHPILVICYTNHALDQFLEGILKFTKEIIRVGGQSKSEFLEMYNIRTQRKTQRRSNRAFNLYRTQRATIQMRLSEIKIKQGIIERAQKFDSILDFSMFSQSNPGLQYTWFVEASSVEQKKWLMGGRTKQKRNAETQDMRLKQLLIQLKIEQNPEASTDNGDSDDEFYDCESDNRKLDDGKDDSDADEDEIVEVTHFSLWDYKRSIQVLENELAEIEANKDDAYEGLVLFDNREAKLEELEKIMEDYEYFQFRMEEQRNIMPTAQLPNVDFSKPNEISIDDRWKMYAFWLRNYLAHLQNSLDTLIKIYQQSYKEFDELKQMEDVTLMRNRKVIGMTTTGAARFQTLLQALKCPIVIVEEAAEVLESHVVVALTDACKHLILIGDHQQLRPSTVEYRLVKEHKLDISLFERMVKNGIHCECLEVQHRMRPEISRLIVPAIYPTLLDHEDVQHYPDVLGVTQNIFFITHTEFELEVTETSSKMNLHEANFIIRLARYLLLQGYNPEDITIITPYSGQKMFLLKERRKNSFLTNLRITDVDDYQGEESKIILLTLVRSNATAKIGFLNIDNRVNVALSRAKEGLFIIGNMDNLMQAHNVWPKIKQVLVEHNQIGTHLTLRCQIHKEETKVRCAEDFLKVPEGGCSNVCGAFLTCGHFCSSICHVIDRTHVNYVCQSRCSKILCTLQHQCPDLCSEKCKPCKVQVFVHLPCDHDAWMPCIENTPDYKCQTLVPATLDCGHATEKRCFENIRRVRCPHPCEIRRPCGHSCEESCHIHDDPDHQIKLCKKDCTRISKDCSVGTHKCPKKCSDDCPLCNIRVRKLRSCGHMFDVPCSYDVEEVNCVKPCKKKLSCLHLCKARCNEPCSTCKVMVNKKVDGCGHTVKIQCHLEATRSFCRGVCPRLLPCGHPCGKSCREQCSTKCRVGVDINYPAACGHTFQIPCYIREKDILPYSQKLLQYCTQPCNTILKCSHVCKGTCGQCVQGRIHNPCKDKCGRTLVCSHVCEIPCNETCPPCNKPCLYRCNHSKCGKTCGEPCTTCAEECSRQCAHIKCSKLCGEECDVDACQEPCPKLLKCKHPCLGFCGDPCPPVCRVCNPDDETFAVYLGNEDELDARFVHLLECNHNIESRAMDNWMRMSDDPEIKDREVQLKKCPKCTTVITKTQRYAQMIKNAYADVTKVKTHWFGDELQNNVNRFGLINRVNIQLTSNERLFMEYKYLKPTLTNINVKLGTQFMGRRNPIHKILINACVAKIQLLERILKICKLRDSNALNENALMLLRLLFKKLDEEESMSRQFIDDLEKEINRFERALQLFFIENASPFTAAYVKPNAKILYDQLVHAIFASTEMYTDALDHEIKLKIRALKDLVDKTMVLTETEKKMIVNAMRLGQGRWFTCPNGHIYCIDACGGAMEVGRCNVCNAQIGGQNHALLSTNRFTSEMDGATRPAWSNNPAMDMRNFEFLD